MFAAAMREKVKSQTSDLSKNVENGLRLTWVCVEVKFSGLFMGFFVCLWGFPMKKGEKEENLTNEER